MKGIGRCTNLRNRAQGVLIQFEGDITVQRHNVHTDNRPDMLNKDVEDVVFAATFAFEAPSTSGRSGPGGPVETLHSL